MSNMLKLRLWLCKHLGWHNGKLPDYKPYYTSAGWDGLSFHARCSVCGKRVMQDSQGNWFTFEKEESDARDGLGSCPESHDRQGRSI